MTLLKRLRTSGKVGLIIGMFMTLSAAQTAISAVNIRHATTQVRDVIDRRATTINGGEAVRGLMVEAQQAALQVALADSPAVRTELREAAAALPKAMDRLHPLLTDGLEPVRANLETSLSAYLRFVSGYQSLLAQGRNAEATALLVSRGLPAYAQAETSIGAVFPAVGAERQKETAAAGVAASQQLWLVVTLSMLGLVIVACASLVFLRREIGRPLESITDAMNRLAEGDLGVAVDEDDRADEVGDLARALESFRQAAAEKVVAEHEAEEQRAAAEEERRRHDEHRAAVTAEQATVVHALADALSRLAGGELAYRIVTAFPPAYEGLRTDFNDAMERLHDAMKTIAGAALGIRAGADEISRSADDLSQRTEQQAASLEETAAALDQITTAVRRAADGAVEVTNVVAAANQDAERSGVVVRDTVAAISQIQQSARQVSQIIGVIDEIAFQTNLLALNAGVEAARAGDAGRGFAVVATEVRALAQRSAQAAKEIKALISTSNDQVETGVQLVGQTGEALERIGRNVTEIHDLIAGIASSSREQASGLHEVNSAIDQMDRMTQQNASLVEESTAASFALAAESQQLTHLIGRFDMGQGQAVAPAAAPTGERRDERRRRPAFRRASDGSAARKPAPEEMDDWQEF